MGEAKRKAKAGGKNPGEIDPQEAHDELYELCERAIKKAAPTIEFRLVVMQAYLREHIIAASEWKDEIAAGTHKLSISPEWLANMLAETDAGIAAGGTFARIERAGLIGLLDDYLHIGDWNWYGDLPPDAVVVTNRKLGGI